MPRYDHGEDGKPLSERFWLVRLTRRLWEAMRGRGRSTSSKASSAPWLSEPVMLIYPLSAYSPAATQWRPQPGAIALVCPPPDIVAVDQRALSGLPGDEGGIGRGDAALPQRVIARFAAMAAERVMGPVHILHCIEVEASQDEARAPLTLPAVVSSDVVYFGFAGEVPDRNPFVLRPSDAADLLEQGFSTPRRGRGTSPITRLYENIVRWRVYLVRLNGYYRRLRDGIRRRVRRAANRRGD
jgi:hypothetical protein